MRTLLLIFISILLISCSKNAQSSSDEINTWFQWGTELQLPESTKFIEGKNYGSWLSDIYLKVQVKPEFLEVISKNLIKSTEKLSLKLPSEMPQLSSWDPDRKELIYFEKTTGSIDEGGFITHLGFEKSTGFIYCHITEYSP